MSLVYKDVFEDGYPVECEWAMEADSADLHKMRDQLRAHAAALEELAKERSLCEYFANGSVTWQHRYEAALEQIDRLNGQIATAEEIIGGPPETFLQVRKRAELAERRAERLKGHAEAMAEHMVKAIVVVGWPEEQSYGDEWSHDADRIIAAYRAEKGE